MITKRMANKWIASGMALATLSLAGTPRNANAAIGVATSPGGVGIGFLVASGVAAAATVGLGIASCEETGLVGGLACVGYIFLILPVGAALTLVLLDEESGDPKFSPVTPEMGEALDLTADVVDRYNQDLNEVNLVAETIAESAHAARKDGATTDEQLELVRNAWAEAESLWSPETVQGLRAVRESIRAHVTAQ
ncbi:MAG: hypothetical protein AAB425_03340 [Bdellovibrionota bacterium]